MKTINVKKRINLTEALKGLDTMTDAEFDTLIDGVLSRIDQVQKVDYSSDLEARVQEIKADAEDVMKNRELSQEDDRNLASERRAAKAKEAEKNKYSPQSFKKIDAFKFNFYNAVKDQVEEVEDEEDTWSVIDRRHEDDSSIVIPGKRMDDVHDDIPSIDVFFDQSGSWGDEDVQIGQAAIASINEFDQRGEIRLNIYYFSDHVHTDAESARDEGGTSAWKEILTYIRANKTKNVVILTDTDMAYQARRGSSLIVDGCVWYIWKNGNNAQELPQHLKGRRGTFQYAFTTSNTL